jgi:hypothetical protein
LIPIRLFDLSILRIFCGQKQPRLKQRNPDFGKDLSGRDGYGEFKNFREIVVEVWQQGLFGVQIGKVLTAAFIFIIFLMLRKLIATLIIKRAKTLADKTTTQIDNTIDGALEQPITMIPVVLGLLPSISCFIASRAPFSGGSGWR